MNQNVHIHKNKSTLGTLSEDSSQKDHLLSFSHTYNSLVMAGIMIKKNGKKKKRKNKIEELIYILFNWKFNLRLEDTYGAKIRPPLQVSLNNLVI